MDVHSAHINSDNEYSFQTYIMEDFHSNSNKFFITTFILHMLPKANPTESLLKVELPCDLFRDRCHLFQQLFVLVVVNTKIW
jgi:hypothetical protein